MPADHYPVERTPDTETCYTCAQPWPCDAFTLAATVTRLRGRLLAHRADLHQYSTRPCQTCTDSAVVLGLLAPNLMRRCPHPDKAQEQLRRHWSEYGGGPPHMEAGSRGS